MMVAGIPEVAKRAIDRGIGVFPCSGKIPTIPKEAGGKGVHDAATTIDEAENLWRAAPSATHVGLAMGSGVVAVDFDTYKCKTDDEKKAHEDMLARLPSTLMQTTQRGGRHVFLRVPDGVEVRNKVTKKGSALPRYVDVRGDGGYVVTGPGYTLTDDEIADAPQELVAMLTEKPTSGSPHVDLLMPMATQTRTSAPARGTDADRDYWFKRASCYLDEIKQAVDGEGGSDPTFRAANMLLDMHLDDADAWDLLNRYSLRCVPPWSEKELRHKLDDAKKQPRRYFEDTRQKRNAPGGDGRGSHQNQGTVSNDDGNAPDLETQDPWKLAVAQARADLEKASQRDGGWGREKLTRSLSSVLDEVPRSDPWLIVGLIRAGAVEFIAGEPKAAKTWLAMDLMLAIATGGKAIGEFQATLGAVSYLSPETDVEDARTRLCALAAGRGIDIRGLEDRIHLAPSTGLALMDLASVATLVASIRTDEAASGNKTTLVVLDPLRHLFDGDENSSETAGAVMRNVRALRDVLDCAIVIVHHSAKQGKDSGARSSGQRMRGSSAFHGGHDGGIYLEDAKEPSVQKRTCTVRVSNRKGKGAGIFPMVLDIKDDENDRASWAVFTKGAAVTGEAKDGEPSWSPTEEDCAAVLKCLPAHGDGGAGKTVSSISTDAGMRKARVPTVLAQLEREGRAMKIGTKGREKWFEAPLTDPDPEFFEASREGEEW